MQSTRFSANLGKIGLGTLAVLLAIGPCTSIFALLFFLMPAILEDGLLPLRVLDPGRMFAKFNLTAWIVSLVASLPIAILNGAIQEALIRWRRDAWTVGAVAGAIAGAPAIAISTGFSMAIALVMPQLIAAMSLASILMGLLYWSIAIKPRRDIRLMMQRADANQSRST